MTWDSIEPSLLCRLLADRYEEEWGHPKNRCACGRAARRKYCVACSTERNREARARSRKKAA